MPLLDENLRCSEARPNKAGGGGGAPANRSLARTSTMPVPTRRRAAKHLRLLVLGLFQMSCEIHVDFRVVPFKLLTQIKAAWIKASSVS